MSTPTHHRASGSTAAELAELLGDDLLDGLAADLVGDIERYLSARGRATAHPLVTATTDELVRTALAGLPAPARSRGRHHDVLPGGIWRLLPDRLLVLHPGRHREAVQRLRITPAQHLELTALVLERWGWAQTPSGWRTPSGRRCILGAQAVLHHLGYGGQDTAITAGTYLQAVLTQRGIRQDYPHWNDQPHVSRDQALTLVREAAALARKAGH
ncbi:DUF6197 family protein [Actinacidiphila yeochonensis]|uniref:DUF6197 family protein n=1 Tax=Actinacidiphila yeochonensis TaxID=89050 RepID=UPI000B30A2C5|nr:hypothetical protein [Actinacidiphila yeochonensis]